MSKFFIPSSAFTAVLAILIIPIFSIRAGAAPLPEEPTNPVLIEQDIELSHKIDEMAKKLDAALTGEKPPPDQPNMTQIIVRNQILWAEGGEFNYAPHLDIKLDLPNLERKWQLKFTTYDEDETSRGINRNRLKTTPIRQSYGGGLGFFQKLGEVNAEFQPRVQFPGKLQLEYLLKLSSEGTVRGLAVHPEVQLFVRSDDGAGEFLALPTDINLSDFFLLTLINEEQYIDHQNLFTANNGLRVGQKSRESVTLNYSLLFESSSRPNYHLDRYIVAFGYEHRIYKNVLHYLVTPYLAFPRTLDFKGSPGVNLEINIIF